MGKIVFVFSNASLITAFGKVLSFRKFVLWLVPVFFIFTSTSSAQTDLSATPLSSPTPKVSPTQSVSPTPSPPPLVSPTPTKIPNLTDSLPSKALPVPTVSPSPIALPIPVVLPSPTPKISPVSNTTPTSSVEKLEKQFLSNILKDQYAIWISPFRLHHKDVRWLAPLSAASITLLATDRRTANALNDNNGERLRISRSVSRLGSGYTVSGTAAAIYVIGRITKNPKTRETGVLAAQALINTSIVTQTLKISTQRPRPLEKNRSGKFFAGGYSFPSGHSSTTWALAAVIDGQYGKKHPLVRIGIYSLATAVSLSRYTGRKHFLSDVLVGSAIGWGIGRFVFLKYHDKSLDSPDEINKTTKLKKYFPLIAPQYNARNKVYGARLTWVF